MSELFDNLKNTCASAKIFLAGRPIAAVILGYMMIHFWTIGGFWGITAAIYCLSTIGVIVRGFIKMIKFHMDDFFLSSEFDLY